ncbi:MAG: iron-sulfur cluster assembly accessory protein [Alphaproteobacteria bacterium]|jgi:iron-sulfur cluster assembly protein|nr:iron-sulfur cluster assembly accessory protein [Alphaproteobacteria bacterium]
MKKQIISLSAGAIDKIKEIISLREPKPLGLRVSLRTKGCSGLSWSLDFIDEVNPKDEHMSEAGIEVYIDPKAVLFVLGSVVDYVKNDLEEGFTFSNPNEKSRCGCGESFTV